MRMKRRTMMIAITVMLLIAGSLFCNEASAQTPTAFTYQGRLTDAGSPANGTYDFEFKLFDGSGTLLGPTVSREDVTVTNGVFLVQLDFGVSPFTPNATASTLEIGVRPGTSTGAFTTLSPRQPITSTPYAVQTINAEKLGGVAADQYVKTDDPRLGGSGNNSYVQNSTTQQPNVSFNIGGNGLFGGQVGIGTQTPGIGLKLDVNGLARFSPGGTGGAIQFGSPNGETGMTISNPFTRADIRYDTGLLKLLNGPAGGPPPNSNGITINTSGDVTVGANGTGIGKLSIFSGSNQPAIYSESTNRAIWGKNLSGSYGVYGESGDGIGVQGVSTNNVGTVGASTNHVGVFGSTSASDPTKPGVQGTSTGASGVGVRGDGTTGVFGNSTANGGIGVTGSGTTGVYGSSTSTNGVGITGESNASGGRGVYGTSVNGAGYGVLANNPSGMALGVVGNATQSLNKGGMVKAMVLVRADATIARCYNSQMPDGGASLPPSGSAGCGLTVSRFDSAGAYAVTFPFTIQDRFLSLSITGSGIANTGANYGIGGQTVTVSIFTEFGGVSQNRADADFMLIIY